MVVFADLVLRGALGGYFAAGGTAATLAFVLAVMTPGVEADLIARELGWIVGVVIAGVAAVVLWPVHQRDRVRGRGRQVLREAAAALAVPAADAIWPRSAPPTRRSPVAPAWSTARPGASPASARWSRS